MKVASSLSSYHVSEAAKEVDESEWLKFASILPKLKQSNMK